MITIAILAAFGLIPFCVLKAVSLAYLRASEVWVLPLVYLKKETEIILWIYLCTANFNNKIHLLG